MTFLMNDIEDKNASEKKDSKLPKEEPKKEDEDSKLAQEELK